MLDILIRNGWVIDGMGNPAYPADVAIEGDRIIEVGRLPGAQARRIIDATGKTVCPGFIDAHSHSDTTIGANPLAQSTVRQGVTTEVVGNCGGSRAPKLRRAPDGTTELVGFAASLQQIEQAGISCNLAWFVGHNTLRRAVGLLGSEPTEDQMRGMEDGVRDAMEGGALGLSTGLEFEPGRLAGTEEVMRLARVAGEYGGYYASHIRNRDAHILQAVDEFLLICRECGTAGEISHLNIRHNTGGPEQGWERAIEKVEQARRQGIRVLVDTTPYRMGTGQLTAILPPWFKAEGPARAAEMLGNPAVRARLRTDCDRYWRFIHRGEWHRVYIVSNALFPEIGGKNFSEIADLWKKDEWDCFFDLLQAHGERMDSVSAVAQLFTEEHVRTLAAHPLYILTVDGHTASTDPDFTIPSNHPIHFAGMTHYLTYHVRETRTLRLEEAIRKMTSMPATHLGLCGRGLLHAGYFADVNVFSLDTLEERSTMQQPAAYTRGMDLVLVNGVPVVENSEHTGARPGRNIARS